MVLDKPEDLLLYRTYCVNFSFTSQKDALYPQKKPRKIEGSLLKIKLYPAGAAYNWAYFPFAKLYFDKKLA